MIRIRPLTVAIWAALYGYRQPLSQFPVCVTDTVAASIDGCTYTYPWVRQMKDDVRRLFR